MKTRILFFVMILLIMAGCSSKGPSGSLKVKIADDGRTFSWKMKGVTIDPVEKKLVWNMENKQWDQDGRPVQSVGKCSFTIDAKEYKAVADFTFDNKGYSKIKLTVTEGDLTGPLSGEAERR